MDSEDMYFVYCKPVQTLLDNNGLIVLMSMTIIDDYAVSPAILVTWLSAISNDINGQDPGAS